MDKKTEMQEPMVDLMIYLPLQEGTAYKTECQHKQDCLKAIRLILDNEATDEQLIHFKENMNNCLPCIENHNLEIAIRKVLCDKIQKKPVPAGLAEKIKAMIY